MLSLLYRQDDHKLPDRSKAEFKEFKPWFKFKPRLKFYWFHLSLYKIFQDLSRRSFETGFRGILEAA